MKQHRHVIGTSLAIVLSATPTLAGEVTPSARPVAVVELFTSQGCANCPPADAFLSDLSREADVVTLSYAVDYWDYMGWKDTAAKPEFTRRQKAYAERRGDHDVFTPQVVINGGVRLVGSDRAGIRREIAVGSTLRHDLTVPIELETNREALQVRLPDASTDGEPVHATVWLARFDEIRSVSVGRGENHGRTLSYAHLVRSLQPIGVWKGRALTIELPRQEMATDPNIGCAVLIQDVDQDRPGRILGARICSSPTS